MRDQEREIYRYLGMPAQAPDEKTADMVAECLRDMKRVMGPVTARRLVPLDLSRCPVVDFTCFQSESADLSRNLSGCDFAVLFSATLGMEADLLIRRYSRVETSRALIYQAAGTALIEEICDAEYEKLRKEMESEGLFLRPRFSPGYGDFSLSVQRELLDALGGPKQTGIMLRDSGLMIPSKSVTAVIGAGRQEDSSHRLKGCTSCGRTDCLYKRQ